MFPNLGTERWELTSDPTPTYNCIAYAAGETRRPWWPDRFNPNTYWPIAERRETLDNFTEAFATLRYERCESSDLEHGHEKVAIYAHPRTRRPTHMAFQLRSGIWASKLGDLDDIEHHSLAALTGPDYGEATVFLRRRRLA